MKATIQTATGRTIPRFIRERRWWWLLLLPWALVVGASLNSQTQQIRNEMNAVALEGARNMFRMVLLTRNWNASHGGVYVPITERTPPNPYLEVPRRDVMTTDGIAMTMVNPAYMTRLIGETAESASGAIFRLTSLNPIRPANAPDDWERKALEAFDQGIRETMGVESSVEGEMLRYMAPLKVVEACLACHAKQGYAVGDVRGGLSVSQRYAPIEAAVTAGVRKSLITHAVAFFLVALACWLLLDMLRRRWLELGSKIQELEETQRHLLQSEKMAAIGQLAAGVAHEINNPVGFVNSNLGSLQKYSKEMIALLDRCRAGQGSEADFLAADFDYLKQDVDDLLRESRDGLERVKKIVADLKDFSHVDESAWQEADINAGVESTLNVVWNELKYKAEVIRQLGELPPVCCIAAQINQVVMNLLVNAAHAIETRGVITLRTGCAGDQVWIEVADTGKGMPPAVMQHIFEPFFTTKAVGKGTGLGLSLAYDIVKKHGGEIEVSSEPGVGSTFRVTLPLRPPAASAG
jgi:two-component system, NtrC family, sensor kinase